MMVVMIVEVIVMTSRSVIAGHCTGTRIFSVAFRDSH